ncbi:hypothetical protein D3C81_1406570 [compost metagenome]
MAALQALGRQQVGDLVGLAAQADQQHRSEVGMHGIAAEGAAQHRQRLATGVDRATEAVGQGDHAIDVGVGRQRLGVDVAAKVVSDRPCHRGRAVHRGEDADVVARGYPAIGAHDTHEGIVVGRLLAFGIDAEGVVAGKFAHRQIVHVHMFACGDRLARETDDLPIAAQGLARAKRAGSHLVARRDRLAHHDALVQQQAFGQRLACHQHIVQWVESDHGVGSACTACCCNELHGVHLNRARGSGQPALAVVDQAREQHQAEGHDHEEDQGQEIGTGELHDQANEDRHQYAHHVAAEVHAAA